MKRTNKTFCIPMPFLLLAALTLLTAGCSAPQASNGLQQRIDELLQVQQQQAQQLSQLQEQLASLSSLPLGTSPPAIEPAEADGSAILPLPAPTSAAETAAISEAAELYLEAFAAIATGQMAAAESGFETFILRFPDHQYAGNANYWLAESLFSQQNTKRAETVLLEIIDNQQQRNKAPAAMARLVNYYRKSNAQKAAAMLQMLSTNYPESPELKRLMRSSEPR
jgi:tol-pal system protein YbgF